MKVEAGLEKVPPTSEIASTTNIVEINTEKISSVNLLEEVSNFLNKAIFFGWRFLVKLFSLPCQIFNKI